MCINRLRLSTDIKSLLTYLLTYLLCFPLGFQLSHSHNSFLTFSLLLLLPFTPVHFSHSLTISLSSPSSLVSPLSPHPLFLPFSHQPPLSLSVSHSPSISPFHTGLPSPDLISPSRASPHSFTRSLSFLLTARSLLAFTSSLSPLCLCALSLQYSHRRREISAQIQFTLLPL